MSSDTILCQLLQAFKNQYIFWKKHSAGGRGGGALSEVATQIHGLFLFGHSLRLRKHNALKRISVNAV